MAAVLELRKLTKRFQSQTAVDDLSLEIESGSFHALLGPSGCGKTTVLRMIAGFEVPDAGEVFLNGQGINHLKPYERNVSTVFQSYALFPHMTVAQNVAFGLKRRGCSRQEIGKRVTEVLDLVLLAGKENRVPAQLSGGERQRVALARSLVLEPAVLLLDEPLSALDPNLRKQVRMELKNLQRRVGITFVFVTHDQEEALSMSDRIAVMNSGRIEQNGSPEDLYYRPRTRFVAGFLGGVNWMGQVGVRPEATRIARASGALGNSVSATVEATTFLGNYSHVQAKLSSGERVVVEVPHREAAFVPGEQVHISWNSADELRPA